MIREAISTLVARRSLSMEQATLVMQEIMEGSVTPAQLGAFLTALSIKGESPDEIAGMAEMMRAKAIQVKVNGPVLDIVGTGGDGLNTFNISTASALVAAGAGIRVAKHGNRAASGKCGSADVLEKLGVKIDLTAQQVQRCIEEVGFGFMFAPNFHPAMKYAAGPRKEIGIRSVFNILGPLTNPARAEYLVIGAPNIELAEKIFSALIKMKVKHAIVVNGQNGMDEISISGRSTYYETRDGQTVVWQGSIAPENFSLAQQPLETITGGSPEINAQIIKEVFEGKEGPRRDVVVLNSAAGLLAGGKAENLTQGVDLAQEVIDSGQARAKLSQLVEFSQKLP